MPVTVEVFDNQFLDLFDQNQEFQIIANDFVSGFAKEIGPTSTNGPVWHHGDQCLYFNNVATSLTFRYTHGKGLEKVFANGTKSVGMCLSRDGRFLVCERATSSLVIRETNGLGRKLLADRYEDVELNSPNDVVESSNGRIYFSDPAFGRHDNPTGVYRPIPSDVRAVYMRNPENHELVRVAAGFDNPNGLCFSPDEKAMYVVNAIPGSDVRVYDVKEDGKLQNERVFAKLANFADGMKVDALGNPIFAIPRGGLDWYSADGRRLGFIKTPDFPLNMCWGDDDLKSLYITCKTSVCKIRTRIPGHDTTSRRHQS